MKKIVTSLMAGLCFSSCAPMTPQARIDKNPEKFAALSQKDKGLVQQGQITRGMPLDAVMLAWGPPSRRFQGSKDSKKTERWDYDDSRPVYIAHFYSDYPYHIGGYGPYDHSRFSGVGLGVGPEVTYVPYRVASVWFINDRLDSWERAR
jgi:hypothetical protein